MKSSYITKNNIREWTENIIKSLEGTKGRTRIPELNRSTFLVWVDPQKIFLSSISPAFIPAFGAIKDNCISLVHHAIAMGGKLIISKHVHPPDDGGGTIKFFWNRLIYKEDPLSDFIEEVNDFISNFNIVVFEKSRHSVFSNDGFTKLMKSTGTATIIIAGVQAHLCVLASAIEAGTNNIIPVVVVDAIASGSEKEHVSAITALSGGLASIMTTSEVIEKWR